jgi:acetyltransferase-like isoleucine patch superfamily enzyme
MVRSMLISHIAKRLKSFRTVTLRSIIGRKLKQQGVRVSYEHPTFIDGGNNISIGNDCSFSRFVQLNARSGEIEIGDYFSLGVNSQIDAENGGFIQIGISVLIGSNVVLRACNHRFEAKMNVRDQGHIPGTIIIGDDVWIGSNSIILPGVCIESHSIIGAGSVVTKNVAAFTVVAGNPARVIKIRS